MRDYHAHEIGNVAVLGHSGCGKTSIVETMAYRAGAIGQIGNIQSGNTISDYSAEEIARQSSINLSIVPIEWDNCKINLIDVPGTFDFVGETEAALSVCESALIICPSYAGISAGTKQAMYKARDKGKIIYINGLDNPNSDYPTKLQQLKDTYGKGIAPIQVPIMDNNKMIGYVNVAKMEGRLFKDGQTHEAPIPENMMDEAVANTSDELLEKYLEEEPFTKEEISNALRQGVTDGSLIPVLCGTDRIGISIILNSMCAFFDSANHPKNALIVKDLKKDDEKILECNEDSPTSLFVFKTITDPFVGKTSYFKVTSGTLYAGMTLYNPKEKEDEKIVKIYQPMGKNLIEVDKLHAGEIGAFTRSTTCHTNDTLCDPRSPILIPDTEYSKPYYKKAIVPLGKSNEEKIANAINRLLEEDPTLVYEYNEETKQQCLSGIGDIHLDTVLNKLKARFKVEAKFEDVKIPYRETIKKEVTIRNSLVVMDSLVK